MKTKFIYLLLLMALGAQAQTIPSYKNIKLTATAENPSATKLATKEDDNTFGYILKSNLIDIIEANTAAALPVTGVAGKIYVTLDNNKIYRFNGTFYQELAVTDITGKVDKNAPITAATKTKITYDAKGLVTSGTDLVASDIPTIAQSQVTNLTTDLATKVDKVAGKGLSTEDYTTAEKTKLAGIQAGATANSTDAQLRDRTTHTGTQAISTVTGLQTALDSKQATLVSGTNIKTIENQSLLGSGNIDLTKSDVGLANVDNTSDLNKPISTATQTALNGKEDVANKVTSLASPNNTTYPTTQLLKDQLDLKISLTQKGAINGVATLGADGKVPNNQIPALAISETFPVNSQAAMLALSGAEQGDVAVRTDISKSFILTQSPASTLGNWQELLTPTDAVQSVNGQSGNVSLTTTNITEGTNLYYTEARVSANVNVAANTAKVTNAAHTGDATGSTVLTLATVNSNVGTFGNASSSVTQTVNAKGLTTAIASVPIQIAESQVTGLVTDLAGKAPASGSASYVLASVNPRTDPNTQLQSSAFRFDPNANNPTNEYYAISTYGNNGNVVGQLATHFISGQTYTRSYNASWSAWRKIWHDGNFNPANYLPLSGGTLTGVLNGTSATFSSSVTASGFFQSSDRRLKYVHKRDGDVAYFTWKDGRDDKMHIGWIAQEMRKQFPDQVQKNEDGYLSVSYIEILVAKNRDLEKKLEALENRINQLEKSK